MTDFISTRAAEKGGMVMVLSPTDENGVALTFGQLKTPQWQLMRTDGTVVNNRTFAASSLTSLEFVLSGNDLALFGSSDNKKRVISFQATYDTRLTDGTVVSDMPLKNEGIFPIDPMLGQADATA